MSGRKSTEVAAVLKDSQQARKETIKTVESTLATDHAAHTNYHSESEDLLNGIVHSSISGDDAAKEFPDEWQMLTANINKAQKLAKDAVRSSSDFKQLLARRDMLQDELAKADAEAERIRQAIRVKDWYCDEEYRDAQKLSKTYKEILSQQKRLLSDSSALVMKEMQVRSLLKEQKEIINSLAKDASNLERRATQRREANTLRDTLKTEISQIDKKNADKFYPGQLATLESQCHELIAQDDQHFLSGADSAFQAIARFSQELDVAVATWQREKANVEDAIQQLDGLSNFSLIGPIEYYNKGENGEKTQLFDFLAAYSGKDVKSEYSELRRELDTAFAEENFASCREIAQKARLLLDAARQEGLDLQQRMIEKTRLAGALQDIMENLRYDTELEIADDNPDHGFRLLCRAGDELIDFDTINIDDEGNPIINLDHKEAIGGGCKASWKTISRVLRDAGIPVTDVRMSGSRSVLYERAHAPQQSSKQAKLRS